MQSINNLLPLGIVFASSLVGSLISYSQVKDQQTPSFTTQAVNIANLKNGNYQFCSQPDPQDWRDGAGVCFNFSKSINRVDGYYGYPHSDHFICIRGIVDDNCVTGEALGISWAVKQLKNQSKSAFKWDSEGRLTLSQGRIIPTINDSEESVDWILYSNAALDLEGFYLYSSSRMTSPSQLCEWNQSTKLTRVFPITE